MYLFQLYLVVLFINLFSSGFPLKWSYHIDFGMHSFNLRSDAFCEDFFAHVYPLIPLVYLSMVVLTDVTFFRIAPPTSLHPELTDGEQSNPPPPPPPPDAWRAWMAATNANT